MTSTRVLAKKAALDLLRNGQRPTAERVRAAIGQGAQQTILSALEELWGEIGARLSEPRLPDPLIEPVRQLWGLAIAEAARQWETERTASLNKIQSLETAVTTLQQQLVAVSNEKDAALERAAAAQALAHAQAARIAEQDTALDASKSEMTRLSGESTQLRDLLQVERNGRERDQAAWLQQIDAARQSVKTSNAEKDRLGKLLEEARDTATRHSLLLAQNAQEIQALKTGLDTATQARDQALSQSEQVARELAQARSEIRQQQDRLQEQTEQLSEHIKASERTRTRLSERLTAAQLDTERMAAENRVLREELSAARASRSELDESLRLTLQRLSQREEEAQSSDSSGSN